MLKNLLILRKVVKMKLLAILVAILAFSFIITGAFAVMVLDGMQTITMPYYQFASFSVCAVLVVYMISYYLLLRRY